MDCRDCQDRLEAFLAGELDRSTDRRMETHLAACTHCGELAEILGHAFPVAAPAPPADLVTAVLERTSGSNCDRARDLLCERFDRVLDEVDQTMLSAHLGGCSACAAVAPAMEQLAFDLSRMAAVQPDRRFLWDVLKRTLTFGQRWAVRWSHLVDGWSRLLLRPRFGLEASYVGAIALWFLFGAPFAPFAEMPGQLLSVVRHSQELAGSVDAVQDGVKQVTLGVEAAARDARQGLEERYWATEGPRLAMKRHGQELGQAAKDLNIDSSTAALRQLGDELGNVVQALLLGTSESSDDAPRPLPNSDDTP